MGWRLPPQGRPPDTPCVPRSQTVAVVHTGEIRTLEKTLPFLRRNVLLSADVHVHSVLQSADGERYGDLLRRELGAHLRSLQWFDPTEPRLLEQRERGIARMPLPARTQRYLRTSGSLIEYQQLAVAFDAIRRCESTEGVTYDWVFRCRTDTVLGVPLDFHWLALDAPALEERMRRLRALLGTDDVPQLVTFFLSTLWCRDVGELQRANVDRMYARDGVEHQLLSEDLDLARLEADAQALLAYLHSDRYALTLRKNLLYLVPRSRFESIPALASLYGVLRQPGNPCYWNAESQFRMACVAAGLSVFNYDTRLEESSVAGYERERFFDAEGNLRPVVYCLVRS